MPTQVITLIVVGAIMFLVIGGLAFLSHYYTLDGIKSKTVGDGQHGTARWATKQEIRQTYATALVQKGHGHRSAGSLWLWPILRCRAGRRRPFWI